MLTYKRASITEIETGGFTAVASSGSIDRDGEIVAPGAFNPLPKSIPVHLGHIIEANNVVARAVPYYRGDVLMIEATFGSGSKAKQARRDVLDGILDSVSIVFTGAQRTKGANGVPTVVSGELLACDLVSVPSNRDAGVLSARGFTGQRITNQARAAALLAKAEAEIAEAKAVLAVHRVAVPQITSTADVRRFLRSI